MSSEQVMALGLVGLAGMASLSGLGTAASRGIAGDVRDGAPRAAVVTSSQAGLVTEVAEAVGRMHTGDARILQELGRVPEVRAISRGPLHALYGMIELDGDATSRLAEIWRQHGIRVQGWPVEDRVHEFLKAAWHPLTEDLPMRRLSAQMVNDTWLRHTSRFWQGMKGGLFDVSQRRWDVVVVGAGPDAANIVAKLSDERPDLRVLVIHDRAEANPGALELATEHTLGDEETALRIDNPEAVTLALGSAGGDILVNTKVLGMPKRSREAGAATFALPIEETTSRTAGEISAEAVFFADDRHGTSEASLSHLIASLPKSASRAPRFEEDFVRPAGDFVYPVREVPASLSEKDMHLRIVRALETVEFEGLRRGKVRVPLFADQDFRVSPMEITFVDGEGSTLDRARTAVALNDVRWQDPTYKRNLITARATGLTFSVVPGETGGRVDPATVQLIWGGKARVAD